MPGFAAILPWGRRASRQGATLDAVAARQEKADGGIDQFTRSTFDGFVHGNTGRGTAPQCSGPPSSGVEAVAGLVLNGITLRKILSSILQHDDLCNIRTYCLNKLLLIGDIEPGHMLVLESFSMRNERFGAILVIH